MVLPALTKWKERLQNVSDVVKRTTRLTAVFKVNHDVTDARRLDTSLLSARRSGENGNCQPRKGVGGGGIEGSRKNQVEFITWKKRWKNLWINPSGQCLLSSTPAGGARR